MKMIWWTTSFLILSGSVFSVELGDSDFIKSTLNECKPMEPWYRKLDCFKGANATHQGKRPYFVFDMIAGACDREEAFEAECFQNGYKFLHENPLPWAKNTETFNKYGLILALCTTPTQRVGVSADVGMRIDCFDYFKDQLPDVKNKIKEKRCGRDEPFFSASLWPYALCLEKAVVECRAAFAPAETKNSPANSVESNPGSH